MVTTPLRILLVEDNEADVLLTKRSLKRLIAEPEIHLVDDLEGCRNQMINFVPDLVISDYNLPACNGLEVLQTCKKIDNSIPFIFLTGTIQDEELAANTILAGATGYVLKKHMSDLDDKLRPLLKQVVINMTAREEVREQIRENKKAVNQIYAYLDSVKTDNKEQQENIGKLKDTLKRMKSREE